MKATLLAVATTLVAAMTSQLAVHAVVHHVFVDQLLAMPIGFVISCLIADRVWKGCARD
jgi:hypothetical protein